MKTESDQYVLGYRRAELERLVVQADQLAPESSWLFDQIGISPGDRVVEIGCGPLGCLELLSSRVGKSGTVIGVERSDETAAFALKEVRRRGLDNVEVVCGDARSTGLAPETFDLATARLVLVNVPQPEQIVAEVTALVRPGGWVAFHEADWAGHVCDPSSEAWDRIIQLFAEYSNRNGIDPFVGRKVPRLLRAAGLDDVRVNPIVHVYPPGHERRTILLDFAENLTERLVSGGLVGERELGELKDALASHLADPGTLVVSHLFFQAWGRKVA